MTRLSLLLTAILGIGINAVAQYVAPEKIPEVVAQKLNADFPGHTNDKWYLVSSGIYRDSFMLNGKPAVAKYDMQGTCWEQQQEIAINQLPAAITNNYQKAFAGYTFLTAVKVETKYKDRPLSYVVSLLGSKANKYGYKELLQVSYSADGLSGAILRTEYRD